VRHLPNFLALQAGWFACVLGAAHAREWLGPLVALALLAAHLARHREPTRQASFLGAMTCLGMLLDSAQMAAGWIRYQGWLPLGFLAPPWIAVLWPLFASTFRASLDWLRPHPLWAAALGALGGPLSYLGAERLGALEILPDRTASLLGLALAWGAALPLALSFSTRFPRRT
jgi:hypothetical protein